AGPRGNHLPGFHALGLDGRRSLQPRQERRGCQFAQVEFRPLSPGRLRPHPRLSSARHRGQLHRHRGSRRTGCDHTATPAACRLPRLEWEWELVCSKVFFRRERGHQESGVPGLIRLRLKDISATAVASALSTRQYPLDRLNLTGAADGTIEGRWTGSPRRAEAEFFLNLVPPAKLQPGQVPVTATARGTYRPSADELELVQFDASTRSTQLHASGKLAASSSLQLSAGTSDLGELQPLIVALHGPNRLPVTLHGSTHFTGVASGKVSAPSLAGHLQIQDFDSIIPATDRAPEQEVHWDSLAADIQLSPHAMAVRHASAVHGETSALFDMSAALSNGQFNPSDTFTANLNLQHADIAEVEALAGYDYPVTGRANLTVQ